MSEGGESGGGDRWWTACLSMQVGACTWGGEQRGVQSPPAITWVVKEDLIFVFSGDGKYIAGSLSKPKFERQRGTVDLVFMTTVSSLVSFIVARIKGDNRNRTAAAELCRLKTHEVGTRGDCAAGNVG